MPKKLFNEEEETYLKENLKGKWARDLAEEFNNKFNRNITTKQLQMWRENHGLKSNVYDIFTKEETKYLKEICSNNYVEDVIELFKEKFHKEISRNQVYVFKRNNNIKSGIDCKFKKGQTFPKERPIGEERIVIEKGKPQTFIKIKNGKWVRKQYYIWEQYYGKKPKDGVIIFLDGNRENFDINNLQLLTRYESNIMAGNRLYFKSKELNKISIQIAKLKAKAKGFEG